MPISYKDPDKTPDILKETERKLAWMKPRWLMTSPIQNRTKDCTLNCFTIAQAEKQMSLHFKPNLKFSLLFFRDSLILHGNFKTKTEPSNQVFLRSSWASFKKKKHSCVRLKVRLTWFTRWLDFCSIIADVFFRSQMATSSEATVKLIFHFLQWLIGKTLINTSKKTLQELLSSQKASQSLETKKYLCHVLYLFLYRKSSFF